MAQGKGLIKLAELKRLIETLLAAAATEAKEEIVAVNKRPNKVSSVPS